MFYITSDTFQRETRFFCLDWRNDLRHTICCGDDFDWYVYRLDIDYYDLLTISYIHIWNFRTVPLIFLKTAFRCMILFFVNKILAIKFCKTFEVVFFWFAGEYRNYNAKSGHQCNNTGVCDARFLPEPFIEEPGVLNR